MLALETLLSCLGLVEQISRDEERLTGTEMDEMEVILSPDVLAFAGLDDVGIFDRFEAVELLDGDVDLRDKSVGIRDGLVGMTGALWFMRLRNDSTTVIEYFIQ